MKLTRRLLAIAITGLMFSAHHANAQNKVMNIGPGQPCMPGFICTNPPPPPPNYGQVPVCYAPNVLVQINTGAGFRYECRYVQTQPIAPIQPQPRQYSQAHYLYCIARYKSYRQATNTYTAFSGQTKFCNSPFN